MRHARLSLRRCPPRNFELQAPHDPRQRHQQRLAPLVQPQFRFVQKCESPILLQADRVFLRQPGECHPPRSPPSPDRSSAPSTRPAPSSSAAAYPTGSSPASFPAQSPAHSPHPSPCCPRPPPAPAPAPLPTAETCCHPPAES